ncbi:MAG: hypothetical protein P8181_05995 [bacterium]
MISHLVDADGNHVVVEYVPPNLEITQVLTGRLDNPTTLFEQLETDGFFDWPDSALVPPPGMDVDSEPLVIVLDTGDKTRRVFTREPHVPRVIQALIDSLDSAIGGMTVSDGCFVCIPKLMRTPDPDLYEIKESSEPWVQSLIRLSIGPFPVVVASSGAETTAIAEHEEFLIHAPQGKYRVKCINWP